MGSQDSGLCLVWVVGQKFGRGSSLVDSRLKCGFAAVPLARVQAICRLQAWWCVLVAFFGTRSARTSKQGQVYPIRILVQDAAASASTGGHQGLSRFWSLSRDVSVAAPSAYSQGSRSGALDAQRALKPQVGLGLINPRPRRPAGFPKLDGAVGVIKAGFNFTRHQATGPQYIWHT